MKTTTLKKLTVSATLLMLLSACATSSVKYGSEAAKTPARGAAGGATAINASEYLQRCNRPVGTVAFNEDDESAYFKHGSRYGIKSPAETLRLFAQQSNCFVIVERGRALKNTQFERQLERSGELRKGSNFGKGQMAAADYTITPSVVLRDNNARGTSGGVLATLGTVLVGGGGKVKHKDVQAMLTMIDNRSGVQVSIAEGSATGTDKEIFVGGLAAPLTIGFAESYARTKQEKIIIGAYLDAFNNLVSAVQSYRPQESAGPEGHGTGGSLKVN